MKKVQPFLYVAPSVNRIILITEKNAQKQTSNEYTVIQKKDGKIRNSTKQKKNIEYTPSCVR